MLTGEISILHAITAAFHEVKDHHHKNKRARENGNDMTEQNGAYGQNVDGGYGANGPHHGA